MTAGKASVDMLEDRATTHTDLHKLQKWTGRSLTEFQGQVLHLGQMKPTEDSQATVTQPLQKKRSGTRILMLSQECAPAYWTALAKAQETSQEN